MALSCGCPTGPSTGSNVQLGAEDVLCTEVWLKVGFADSRSGGDYLIKRDGDAVLTGHFSGVDTLVADTTVSPGSFNNYVAYRIVHEVVSDSSKSVQVRTMDTTSHEFNWETFVLGVGNSSILRDAAIINDTLIYAVGEIYDYDSTGQVDLTAYNLVMWDGRSWQLRRIQFLTFCSQPYTGSYPARSIFEFGPQDVWMTSGSQIVHWYGTSQSQPVCIPVSANRLWGTSNQTLYAGGINGGLAWYNGTTWQKLPSGTSTNINDVFGSINSSTGRVEVYCAVSDYFQPGDRKILRVTGNKVDSVKWNTGRIVASVWTADGNHLYACGDGLFENIAGRWREMKGGVPVYTYCVRGNDRNDIVAVGDFGLIEHWNGVSMKTYTPIPDASYLSVGISRDMVVAVGTTGDRAVVSVGRR